MYTYNNGRIPTQSRTIHWSGILGSNGTTIRLAGSNRASHYRRNTSVHGVPWTWPRTVALLQFYKPEQQPLVSTISFNH